MKEQIKNIIESYCEGINHLEFNIDDLDKMVDEIVALKLQQIADISNACNDYVEGINMQCAKCDEPKYKHKF